MTSTNRTSHLILALFALSVATAGCGSNSSSGGGPEFDGGTGGASLGGSGGASGEAGSAGTGGTAGQSGGSGGSAGQSGGSGGSAGQSGGSGGSAGQSGGTGGGPASCSIQTCPNGCCDGSVCVAGTANDKCGVNGVACQTCGSGLSCVEGDCVLPSCDQCDGCCSNGQCFPGTSPDACGRDGDACVACSNGESCSGGECIASQCDSTNCNGCCTANGECLTLGQQTEYACGHSGEACTICETGAMCEQGTCVGDQPCSSYCFYGCCNEQDECIGSEQDSSACGSSGAACEPCPGSLSCVWGACVAEVTYELWIVSAVLPSYRDDGSSWDGTVFQDPLPDGFVGVSSSHGSTFDAFSDTIDDTITPQWNERLHTYTESELVSDGLYFEFRESDGYGQVPFERIGSCSVLVLPSMMTGSEYEIGSCGSVEHVRIRLVEQ